MPLHPPSLARRWLISIAVATLAALAAFVALTALGVGGGGGRPQNAVTSLAQEDHISSKVRRYSHTVAVQEGDVPAGAPPNPEDMPISPQRFRGPIEGYRAYARSQLRLLSPALTSLGRALAAADRAQAERAWLVAFERYLGLGAVYGLFPNLNRAIDGTAATLRRGVASPRFAGLHRIEYGLWRGQPLGSLIPALHRLQRDVARLEGVVATVRITPKEYARRAHEILEDAARDFLSGDDVPYSHEGVAATAASLAATDEVLRTLERLLGGQSSVGPQKLYLARLKGVLDGLRARNGGRWPTLGQLSQYEREQLNGSLAVALAQLSAVPDELAVHLPTPVPSIPKGRR